VTAASIASTMRWGAKRFLFSSPMRLRASSKNPGGSLEAFDVEVAYLRGGAPPADQFLA